MVSITNIYYGIEEPTRGYQNCNTSQTFIFERKYVKVRESLYICVIIWVNTILNHADTGSLLP